MLLQATGALAGRTAAVGGHVTGAIRRTGTPPSSPAGGSAPTPPPAIFLMVHFSGRKELFCFNSKVLPVWGGHRWMPAWPAPSCDRHRLQLGPGGRGGPARTGPRGCLLIKQHQEPWVCSPSYCLGDCLVERRFQFHQTLLGLLWCILTRPASRSVTAGVLGMARSYRSWVQADG